MSNNNPWEKQPSFISGPDDPEMALLGGPVQYAGKTGEGLPPDGGPGLDLTDQASILQGQSVRPIPVNPKMSSGQAEIMKQAGPDERIALADTLPVNNAGEEALFGGIGLTGVLGIANMAAGIGRQIYEGLKPKKRPPSSARGMGGNPMR
jgi:hypothetical protein